MLQAFVQRRDFVGPGALLGSGDRGGTVGAEQRVADVAGNDEFAVGQLRE